MPQRKLCGTLSFDLHYLMGWELQVISAPGSTWNSQWIIKPFTNEMNIFTGWKMLDTSYNTKNLHWSWSILSCLSGTKQIHDRDRATYLNSNSCSIRLTNSTDKSCTWKYISAWCTVMWGITECLDSKLFLNTVSTVATLSHSSFAAS